MKDNKADSEEQNERTKGRIEKFIHPDLLNGSIFKSLLCFTAPMLVSYIFQQFYNAADTIIIGHYLGENSLAAIGASVALFDLFVGFGIGFGNGLSIVAARAFGAGEMDQLKKVTAASIIITAAVTLFIMLMTAIFLRPVLSLLGTPPEIFEETYSYISIITKCVAVLFAFNLFSGMLRAIGNSFVPLLFLVFSSLLNVFLDILFMTKFSMGISGAATATVISQGASALLCGIYIIKKAGMLVPSIKHFSPSPRLYRDLAGQGLSMACMGSIVMSGTVILQSSINSFGPLIIAGHITARKIFSLTNIPLITLGQAFSTFTSQNLGAGKISRIKSGARWGLLLSAIYTAAMLVFIPLSIKPLVAFMSGSQNPELLSYSFKYMIFAAFFYFFLGGIFVTRNSLQGLGSKVLPLISSVIELLGKILFVVAVIPRLGLWGIIMCEPLIWTVMFINLIWLYIKNPVWKNR